MKLVMPVFVTKIGLMTSISLVIKQKVLLQKCRFPSPVSRFTPFITLRRDRIPIHSPFIRDLEKRSGDDNLSRESFMPLASGTLKDENDKLRWPLTGDQGDG